MNCFNHSFFYSFRSTFIALPSTTDTSSRRYANEVTALSAGPSLLLLQIRHLPSLNPYWNPWISYEQWRGIRHWTPPMSGISSRVHFHSRHRNRAIYRQWNLTIDPQDPSSIIFFCHERLPSKRIHRPSNLSTQETHDPQVRSFSNDRRPSVVPRRATGSGKVKIDPTLFRQEMMSIVFLIWSNDWRFSLCVYFSFFFSWSTLLLLWSTDTEK